MSSFAPLVLTAFLAGPVRAAGMEMGGAYGPYPMSREASGTSWQPESTPHEGLHLMTGDWTVMAHGSAWGVYDHQGGPRGGSQAFSASMLMAMARRPLGPGTLGLRGMASLDPAMGPKGYRLLLQTGETADGVSELVDRQHPHDLFMELAASYSLPVGEDGSVFAYLGLPGEPALGPPAFMHRFSALENPQAPLTHHWLDSTHITYGVATLGATWGGLKLDASAFRGREPDRRRWDIEEPKLDSFSGRLTWNPGEDWSVQASYGRLKGPEELAPDEDVGRFTASATRAWANGSAQSTFAYGRNSAHDGPALDAFLLETALRPAEDWTVFGRAERVEKDELFQTGPLAGRVFTVHELSLGAVKELARWRSIGLGLGAVASLYYLPEDARPAYGGTPGALLVFLRAKLL